jgi:hypothetical protein
MRDHLAARTPPALERGDPVLGQAGEDVALLVANPEDDMGGQDAEILEKGANMTVQEINEERFFSEEQEDVSLEVRALAKGTYDPGKVAPPEDAYPPEEEVELEIVEVKLSAFGLKWDLTAAYLTGDEPKLREAVEKLCFDSY